MAQQSARIVKTPGTLGGEPRIEERRISVLQVYEEVEGRERHPSEIAERYDLNAADVYHALAYYYDNETEMADVRRRRQEIVEKHREDTLTPEDRDETSS